ncbi:PEGA domain-containing protein [Thermodesulfobacteriota bacterium]
MVCLLAAGSFYFFSSGPEKHQKDSVLTPPGDTEVLKATLPEETQPTPPEVTPVPTTTLPEETVQSPQGDTDTPVTTIPMGILSINTVPAKVRVIILGQGEVGVTPLNLDLLAGRHDLTLVRKGYHDVALAVAIHESERVPLSINMIKK